MKAAGSLSRHQRDWEKLGEYDPLWAILSRPGKRYGGWNAEEFFETGRREIAGVLEEASKLGRPERRQRALDFGCGVGRLTRALSEHFDQCRGIDISSTMIARARELNADRSNIRFAVNSRADLGLLQDSCLDFIYSNIVLQHVPDKAVIRRYIGEFVRVLRPDGLAVFQLPCNISLRVRLNPRKRLYTSLKSIGLPDNFLYHRLRLSPIAMNWLSLEDVERVVLASGGQILQIKKDDQAGPGNDSRTYFVTRT